MSSKERIEFHGLDGQDPAAKAEDFVVAIKSRAFQEGKQRDNDWLCDFAATCFRGEALRWFARLELEDTKTAENWKSLQHAILTQYPRQSHNDTDDKHDEPETAQSIPTPAAAAAAPQGDIPKASSLGQSQAAQRRIRVVDEHNGFLGYLGPEANSLPPYWDGCLDAAASSEDAFLVRLEPSMSWSNMYRLVVMGPRSSDENKWLGFRWEDVTHSRAAVTLFSDSEGDELKSGLESAYWSGEARTEVWHVDDDHNVVPMWHDREDGSWEAFGFIVNKPVMGGNTTVLQVKPDAENYATRSMSWYFARLVLDDP